MTAGGVVLLLIVLVVAGDMLRVWRNGQAPEA